MGMAWDRDLMREDHPAALAISGLRNLARYAPVGKRVHIWMEWTTEADEADIARPFGDVPRLRRLRPLPYGDAEAEDQADDFVQDRRADLDPNADEADAEGGEAW
jgi:hypothetical protein